MGVLGDIAWRKWCSVLTDEVPLGSLLGISSAIRLCRNARVMPWRARGCLQLLLLRDYSVSGGDRPMAGQKDTPEESVVSVCHGKGVVSPAVGVDSDPPLLFRESCWYAKNTLKVGAGAFHR